MLATLIIVFREVLEAGLIVGIVLAATAGIPRRGLAVALGIASGAGGACLLAAFAGALSSALQGFGQEAFTAAILCLAVVMLGWHTVWMARHSREMKAELQAVGRAVKTGSKTLVALAVVVGVAVLREGSEVVLFLYGIAVSSHDGAPAMLAGAGLGLAAGALVSWLLYRGLLAIPLRRLFTVTNGLITLLAAGLAGQAAAVLASADLVPRLGDHLWDTSRLLSEESLPGRALHALIGYSDRPPGVQVAAYAATLIALLLLSRWVGGGGRRATPAAAAPSAR